MTRPWIPSQPVHHHHHLIHDLLPLCSLWLLGTIVQIATKIRVALALFDTLLVSFSISVLLVQIHLVCQHPHQCHQSNPVSLCQSDPLMCALQNQSSLNLLLWINLHALYASVLHLIVLHEQWWHYTSTWVKKIQSRAAIITFFVEQVLPYSSWLMLVVVTRIKHTHNKQQQQHQQAPFFYDTKLFAPLPPLFYIPYVFDLFSSYCTLSLYINLPFFKPHHHIYIYHYRTVKEIHL